VGGEKRESRHPLAHSYGGGFTQNPHKKKKAEKNADLSLGKGKVQLPTSFLKAGTKRKKRKKGKHEPHLYSPGKEETQREKEKEKKKSSIPTPSSPHRCSTRGGKKGGERHDPHSSLN